MITETGGNAGSNRPGCSPVSPLQAEAAGIIREAQDFCRQYGSPEELAKYPVASLVLRLAHALKQLTDELDRRCPHDPDYEHNAAEVAEAHRQWREAAKVIPLYRIQAFGDDAKAAILEAAGCYVAECDELQAAGVVVESKRLAVADTLRGLLERTTL